MPKPLFTVSFPFEYDDSLPAAENRAQFLRALNKAGREHYRKRNQPNPSATGQQDEVLDQNLDQATAKICADIYRTMPANQTSYRRRQDFIDKLIHRLGPYLKGRHKGQLRSMEAAARILDAFLRTIPYQDARSFLDGRQAWWGRCNHVCESVTTDEDGNDVYEGWEPSWHSWLPNPPLRSQK
jgi:hypothetical protein